MQVISDIPACIIFFSENTNMKYPFFYRHLKAIDEDGWELFNTEVEFSKLVALTQQWRISHANSNFEVSFEGNYCATLLGMRCGIRLVLITRGVGEHLSL